VVAIALYLGVDAIGPLILGTRVLHGLAEALLFTSLFTYAADHVPASRRTEGLAIFGVSGMLPISIGGVLGDVVLARSGYHGLFVVALALAVVALGLSWPLRDRARRTSGDGVDDTPGGFRAVLDATFGTNLADGAVATASAVRGGDPRYEAANVLDGTHSHREYAVSGCHIRARDGQPPRKATTPFLVTDRWGYTPVGAYGRCELYDLASDPLAETDVVADHPDQIADLYDLLLSHLVDHAAPHQVVRIQINQLHAFDVALLGPALKRQKDQALFLAVFGQVADTLLHSVLRAFNRNILTIELYLAFVSGLSTKQRPNDVRPAGARKSCYPEYFTGGYGYIYGFRLRVKSVIADL